MSGLHLAQPVVRLDGQFFIGRTEETVGTMLFYPPLSKDDAGGPEFKELRAKGESHPIESTGRELRKLMAWVKSHDSDYVEGTATR